MANDTRNVAITTRLFDGGDMLQPGGRRVGDPGSKSLSQILRNFVDELTERQQSGEGTIAALADEAIITLSPAMPDTNYDVSVTLRTTTAGAANGTVTLEALIVPDADKAAGSFKVKPIPAGAMVAETKFYWFARSRTRINTKG